MIFHPGTKSLLRHIDRDLPAAQLKKIDMHVQRCARCREKLNTFKDMETVLTPKKPVPQGLKDYFISNLVEVKRIKQPTCGEIKAIKGIVIICRNGDDEGIEGFPGMALKKGDTLKPIGNSLALIELNDGSNLYLNKETEIEFPTGNYPLSLLAGELFAMMKPREQRFEIKTPSAVLCVIGTDFDAQITKKNQTILQVIKGKVSFKNESGSVIVKSKHQVAASQYTKPKPTKIKDAKTISTWTTPIRPKKRRGGSITKNIGLILLLLTIIIAGILYVLKVPRPERVPQIRKPLPMLSEEQLYRVKEKLFPKEVYDYTLRVHKSAMEKLADSEKKVVNTQLLSIEEKLDIWMGVFAGVKNPVNQTLSGEIHLGSTDYDPNLVTFNESGELLKIRLVKKREGTPGNAEVYITLDKPWLAGEKRIFFSMSKAGNLRKLANQEYAIKMQNNLGVEGIQQFCLILPPLFTLKKSSENYISREKMGRFDVYFWEKHVYPNQGYRVDLVLEHNAPLKEPSYNVKPKSKAEKEALQVLRTIQQDMREKNYERIGEYGINTFLSWKDAAMVKDYLERELNDNIIGPADYVFKGVPTKFISSGNAVTVALSEPWHNTTCNLVFGRMGDKWVVWDINNLQGAGQFIDATAKQEIPKAQDTRGMSAEQVIRAFYQAMITKDPDKAVGYLAFPDNESKLQYRNGIRMVLEEAGITEIRQIRVSRESALVIFSVTGGFPGLGVARRPDERQGKLYLRNTSTGLKIDIPRSSIFGDRPTDYQ